MASWQSSSLLISHDIAALAKFGDVKVTTWMQCMICSWLQVLDFMSRQFGDAGAESSANAGAEIMNFRKVHATIKYLAQRAA